MDISTTSFFFVVCQNQSNDFCKSEITRQLPQASLAFSRPGFLTLKIDDPLAAIRTLNTTFARTCGLALNGKRSGDTKELIRFVVDTAQGMSFEHLHVFQRDQLVPGKHNFEPGLTTLASELAERIRKAIVFSRKESSSGETADKKTFQVNKICRENEMVLDVVLVEPDHWWIGFHVCESVSQRWPGGVPIVVPTETISRAYFKTYEAILWSQIPVRKDDVFVELGSAPGGSCQFLLENDLKVIAIDPAEMHESLIANPRMTHIKRRGKEVKRNMLLDAKWLICDANVSPLEVFSTIESWLNDGVKFRGLLLTLKISDKDWYEQVDEYRKRIRGWGFKYVKTRQLAFNRNEICLMALKNKAVRRFG